MIAAANSREQAGLLFTAAAEMLDASPVLKARAITSRAAKRITDRVSRSVFRAIAADPENAHGLSASLWLYDELHMAKNSELLDALRRPQALAVSRWASSSLQPASTLLPGA